MPRVTFDFGDDQRTRPRIFPSLCDWLDDEVPIEWLADFLRVIVETPNLDWLLLTKRPENWDTRIRKCVDILSLQPEWIVRWTMGNPPPNVWIGVSVEDERRDERIPALLDIPARVRFVSAEPLLAPVDFDLRSERKFFGTAGIHWVIVGGESGPKARPCNLEWIRDIIRQCKAAGTACFVKQLGSFVIEEEGSQRHHILFDHPKGGDIAEWESDLRVRQFPKGGIS